MVGVALFVHVLLGGNGGHNGQILYQPVCQRAVGKIAQHDTAARKIAGMRLASLRACERVLAAVALVSARLACTECR